MRAVPTTSRPEGLCPSCAHVRTIRSAKGSVFLMCERARHDARFTKYPPQPVRRCPGWTAGEGTP